MLPRAAAPMSRMSLSPPPRPRSAMNIVRSIVSICDADTVPSSDSEAERGRECDVDRRLLENTRPLIDGDVAHHRGVAAAACRLRQVEQLRAIERDAPAHARGDDPAQLDVGAPNTIAVVGVRDGVPVEIPDLEQSVDLDRRRGRWRRSRSGILRGNRASDDDRDEGRLGRR